MSKELKPCPLCGSEAKLTEQMRPYIRCSDCSLVFGAWANCCQNEGFLDGILQEEFLIQDWNTRIGQNYEKL